MTAQKKIEAWLSLEKEGERVEFKRTLDQKKLVSYCAALANEGGGQLVLGLTDALPREVCGSEAFPELDKIKLTLYNILRLRIEVTEATHTQKRILIFDIPSRPVGQAIGHNGEYLMRVGESLVGMTFDQLKKIADEGKSHFLKQISASGLSAAELISKLDVQAFFELLKLPFPADPIKIIDRLFKEGMVVSQGESYAITNQGALLLARNIKDFPSVSRRAPRLLVYKGTSKIQAIKDIPGQKGYAVGFKGLIATISEQLPSNEIIKDALRTEVGIYPEIAIRELIANALIHQDFDETGSTVMIEIYSDRMEISNPGIPMVSTDRFIDEYKTRNEMLTDFMRRVGICEERGSGIDKVASSIEAYQLPAPNFRVAERHTTAILYAHKDFKSMDSEDRIRACYLHCCLQYVTNQRMTNQTLRERFKLPEDKSETVSRIIADSVENDRIKSENPENSSKRYAKYIPYWAS